MCYSEEEMPRVAKDKVEKDIIENVKAVGEASKSSNRTKKSASVKAVEKDNNPKKTKNKSTSDVAKKGSSSKETKTTKKATDKKILPEGLLPLLKPLERKKILLNLI